MLGVVMALVVLGVVAGAVIAEVSWRRGHPQVAAPAGASHHAVAGPPGSGAALFRDRAASLLVFRVPALAWVLLGLVALGAIYPLVVQVRASGAFAAVILSLWSLAPFAAMAVLVLAAARVSRAALVVIAPGVLALGYLGVWILQDFQIEASSTASLIFLWLPVYQGGVVVVTAAAAAVVYLLVWTVRRARRSQVRSAAGGS